MTAGVAVIGCGSWSTEAHLPALATNPDAELVALVDPIAEAREAAAARFGVDRTYGSHQELFAEQAPAGVVVATPHVHHYEPARAALEAGAHVLVEKPFVLEPAHGRALQRLAQERGREVIVGYPWHYNRQAIQLREAVRAGRLGRLEFASCFFGSMVREYYRGDTLAYQPEFKLTRAPRSETYSEASLAGGGQGQTQVTHSAALLFWLTGLRPRRVAAFCESFDLDVDLVDAASIVFHGGAVGTIGSTGDRPSGHEDLLQIHLCGTDGIATFDVMAGRLRLYGPNGDREELDELAPDQRYPHWAPANNLVDVVLGRGKSQSPAEIGCVTVEFLTAMYGSAAADGAPSDLPPKGRHV
jgi:predicted dehydrogenase